MKSNNLETFLGRIFRKEPCLGTCVTMSGFTGSEIAAEAGFDFTWMGIKPVPAPSAGINTLHLKGPRNTRNTRKKIKTKFFPLPFRVFRVFRGQKMTLPVK